MGHACAIGNPCTGEQPAGRARHAPLRTHEHTTPAPCRGRMYACMPPAPLPGAPWHLPPPQPHPELLDQGRHRLLHAAGQLHGVGACGGRGRGGGCRVQARHSPRGGAEEHGQLAGADGVCVCALSCHTGPRQAGQRRSSRSHALGHRWLQLHPGRRPTRPTGRPPTGCCHHMRPWSCVSTTARSRQLRLCARHHAVRACVLTTKLRPRVLAVAGSVSRATGGQQPLQRWDDAPDRMTCKSVPPAGPAA